MIRRIGIVLLLVAACVQAAVVMKPAVEVRPDQKTIVIKLDNPNSGSTGYAWYLTYDPANPFVRHAKTTDGSIFTFNIKAGRPTGSDFRIFVSFSSVGPGKSPSEADEQIVFPILFKSGDTGVAAGDKTVRVRKQAGPTKKSRSKSRVIESEA